MASRSRFLPREAEEDLRHGRTARHGMRRADGRGGGGAWAEDGTIVFLPALAPGVSLWRVSSAGGKAEPLTSLAKGEFNARGPRCCRVAGPCSLRPPIARGLSTMRTSSCSRCRAERGRSCTAVAITAGICRAVTCSTSTTVVLFAVPFDLDRLESTGQATAVLEGVTSNTHTGSAQFAVSTDGPPVYMTGRSIGEVRPVDWMDRAGNTTPLWVSPANWFNVRFAPDGRRIAVELFSGSTSDIWIYDSDREMATPLNRDPAANGKRCGLRMADASRSTRTATTRRTTCTGSDPMGPATCNA